MRINQFVAQAIGLSRRSVDKAIIEGRVDVNNKPASIGQNITETDKVTFDSRIIELPLKTLTILLNKPAGFVCSRRGQGSKTIYELLPKEYMSLKYVGRLDKESSGLVVLTNNGELANQLSHPSYEKSKLYEVLLNKPIKNSDIELIKAGKIIIDNKPSIFDITEVKSNANLYSVELHEGRNRQIRRTFEKLDYEVINLKRLRFGLYDLSQLGNKLFIEVT